MKNIHLIPTDKPSRLSILNSGKLNFGTEIMSSSNSKPQHIYITSSEEIKEGDKDFYIIANDRDKTWINHIEKVIECKIDPKHGKVLILSSGFIYIDEGCKIILTTDQELIKNGVQAIDDEFLEWFVKNPSCEEVEVRKERIILGEVAGTTYIDFNYKIIIPQEEPKQIKCYCGHTITCDCEPLQETLEETAERLATNRHSRSTSAWYLYKNGIIEGAKWQAEKMYSEEDMINFHKWAYQKNRIEESDKTTKELLKEWFEQFKKNRVN